MKRYCLEKYQNVCLSCWSKAQFAIILLYFQLLPMPQKLLQISDDSHEQAGDLLAGGTAEAAGHSFVNIQQKYYEEYKKIYLTAFKLRQELTKLTSTHSLLNSKITNIETHLANLHRRKREEQQQEDQDQAALDTRGKGCKRNRRTAEQIQRKFECPYQYCDRCYGSDGSLQQHLKLKHPDLYIRHDNSSSYN